MVRASRTRGLWVFFLAVSVVIAAGLLTPCYGTDEAALKQLKEKLITAGRIMDLLKLATPFGHVSVRIPGTETFLITRAVAPGVATVDDVLVCDLNGKVLEGRYKTTFTEVVAHSEVYKKRPDINSVIHSHSPYVIALSLTGATVVPSDVQFPQIGPEPVAVYKRVVLLDKPQFAAEAADLLGADKAVILRGHGALCVGRSIEDVLYVARNLENSAMIQLLARSAGKLIPLTEEEKAPIAEYRKRADMLPGTGADREFTYYSTMVHR